MDLVLDVDPKAIMCMFAALDDIIGLKNAYPASSRKGKHHQFWLVASIKHYISSQHSEIHPCTVYHLID